jgi:hypothetical protein
LHEAVIASESEELKKERLRFLASVPLIVIIILISVEPMVGVVLL